MKRVVGNILVLVIAVIVFLLLFEVFLRVFIPQTMNVYTYDEDYVFAFRPHSSINYKSVDFEQPVTFNSQGFRDNEYDYSSKPENTYRVLMLGDSFTAGLEVELEDTFVKIVEKELQKENPKIEVLNAGTDGWSTEQELLFLEKRGLKYDPDMVVLAYFVGNDQIDNVQRPLFTYEDKKLAVDTNRPPSLSYPRAIYYFLSSNFHTFNLVRYKYGAMRAAFGEPPTFDYTSALTPYITPESTDDVKYSWDKTFALLDRMHNVLSENNIEFVIIIIPDWIQELPELREKYEIDDAVELNKPQQEIKAYALENNIEVIDLLPLLQEHSEEQLHFPQDFHWNEKGHALVAQEIAPRIINFINETK